MTKPEAKDDIASGEEKHGYYHGMENYTLHLAPANELTDNSLI
jgi:hypothetical protein